MTPLEGAFFQSETERAIYVQSLDDSLNSAIRTTYRISLRSSSLREPRYPSAGVVLVLEGGTCAARSGTRCQRGRHDAPSQPEPTLLRCGLATVCRRRGSVVSRPHKNTAETRTHHPYWPALASTPPRRRQGFVVKEAVGCARAPRRTRRVRTSHATLRKGA